jgi:hypothetical protein
MEDMRRLERANIRSPEVFSSINDMLETSSPVDIPFRSRHVSNCNSLDSYTKKVVKFSFPSEMREAIDEIQEAHEEKIVTPRLLYSTMESDAFLFSSVESMSSSESVPVYPTELSKKNVEEYYLQWCVNSKSEMIVKLLEDIQLISTPLFKINLTGSSFFIWFFI